MTPTREQWLESAQDALVGLLPDQRLCPDRPRVSVGFPKAGRGVKGSAIGQCFPGQCAGDGRGQLFISPVIEDGPRAMDILLHEMIHHTVGCEHGHKGPFVTMIRACGLEGKPTATVAGLKLAARLNGLIETLGPYPHSALNLKDGKRPQGTRMLKITCPSCDWTARATQTRIDEGLPTCHCGTRLETADERKDP